MISPGGVRVLGDTLGTLPPFSCLNPTVRAILRCPIGQPAGPSDSAPKPLLGYVQELTYIDRGAARCRSVASAQSPITCTPIESAHQQMKVEKGESVPTPTLAGATNEYCNGQVARHHAVSSTADRHSGFPAPSWSRPDGGLAHRGGRTYVTAG